MPWFTVFLSVSFSSPMQQFSHMEDIWFNMMVCHLKMYTGMYDTEKVDIFTCANFRELTIKIICVVEIFALLIN